MSILIGALLDVSASMRSNIGNGLDKQEVTWIHSIFRVIDDLIKHDVSRNNYLFAVGVGASHGKGIFDIIQTIQHFQTTKDAAHEGPASYKSIKEIFDILEKNGASRHIREAAIDDIRRTMSQFEANVMLEQLKSSRAFVNRMVKEVIPFVMETRRSYFRATLEDVQVLYAMAITSLNESLLIGIDKQSIYSAHDVINIIHDHVGNEKLTLERIQQLLKIVEPFIFGRTPLYSALSEACKLFVCSQRALPEHHKLLFVLSDGEPTDEEDLKKYEEQLRGTNVTVVGCYISRSSKVEPRRLHSAPDRYWENGAKFLFNLSSYIPTELVTRAVFIKHGWQIDVENNETRLFLQVNHPDNLKDACELARSVVCRQDALTDILASVSLDVYISQKNTSIKAQEQIGGTCYANASAAVLYLAMHRILGRDDGYPEFDQLRNDIISRHGNKGAPTFQVLEEICPLYRLQCRQVDVNGALKAVAAKRPVVAKFRLTDVEWTSFSKFYSSHPTGILTKRDLDITKRNLKSKTDGHAVVLTSFDSKCLRFMNSWGDNWADMGFFRIESADVLGVEFIDVFWTLNDLTKNEKEYYSKHGSEVASKLMKSLKSLQIATFTCPLCDSTSKVTEFTGTVSNAECPVCHRKFPCIDGKGNILALEMYITSMSR